MADLILSSKKVLSCSWRVVRLAALEFSENCAHDTTITFLENVNTAESDSDEGRLLRGAFPLWMRNLQSAVQCQLTLISEGNMRRFLNKANLLAASEYVSFSQLVEQVAQALDCRISGSIGSERYFSDAYLRCDFWSMLLWLERRLTSEFMGTRMADEMSLICSHDPLELTAWCYHFSLLLLEVSTAHTVFLWDDGEEPLHSQSNSDQGYSDDNRHFESYVLAEATEMNDRICRILNEIEEILARCQIPR